MLGSGSKFGKLLEYLDVFRGGNGLDQLSKVYVVGGGMNNYRNKVGTLSAHLATSHSAF